MRLKIVFWALLISAFFNCTSLFAEETAKKTSPLPNGYQNITLGMSLDSVKQTLQDEALFGYRGERDVSMLKNPNRVLIETSALSFLKRCWFQFYEDSLYTIILKMNEDMVDYYSIFKTLNDKYGEPTSLNPEKVVWKNDSVILSLEKPLTLKYIDVETFNKLQEQSKVEATSSEVIRKNFLESL